MAGYAAAAERRPRARIGGRLILAFIVAAISVISYFGSSSKNPVTGQTQRVAMSIDQEIALGLQAGPQMAAQHGGLSSDANARARVNEIGQRLLTRGIGRETPYKFAFHLLADPDTINAFALPGGQVFITEALYRRLTTDGQVAAVLAHEIGHVLERHSAQHLAKARLTQGLTGAAVLATYDPDNPSSRNTAAMAAMVGQLINLRYGRQDELQSDEWGVKLSAEAGYDPRAMLQVIEILDRSTSGARPAEFFSTHPNPENRLARIKEAIQNVFPSGVPENLEP